MTTPKLGVLQLQTTFPRPPGDVSNPASWPFPITVGVVKEATATNVVGGTWGPELIDAFVREAERLQGEGCVALVTSCGFLATMHPQLSARVPFIGTSALLQVAWLQNTFYPGQQHAVGVMTFKRSALHLVSVGAGPDTPVVGMPEDDDPAAAVFRAVLDERVPSAKALVAANPGLKAIVLECTNMPPFAHAVAKATGLRVWDIITLGKWLYNAAVKEDYRS
ncbi:uncharacterized protein EHS24_003219 [Apiotrichum porosum]|uniref:Aspartate/glutamate racemase family protein n=1 Tax=Apiotrichum porosum TaxID=105984 RepID=A0A427XFP8_9TREE|nr:uncharacterized protein EHS24_003219 [Apiotrichum porosum]RSH77658.1 hypothetical protein EHS24_003219 [Apiotrichum porosum]